MNARRIRRATLLATPLVGVLLLAGPASAQGPDPVGLWNLQTRNMAERATGGVRNVILRIEKQGDGYVAHMTSPRNTFLEVDEVTYDSGKMLVIFGAYE